MNDQTIKEVIFIVYNTMTYQFAEVSSHDGRTIEIHQWEGIISDCGTGPFLAFVRNGTDIYRVRGPYHGASSFYIFDKTGMGIDNKTALIIKKILRQIDRESLYRSGIILQETNEESNENI